EIDPRVHLVVFGRQVERVRVPVPDAADRQLVVDAVAERLVELRRHPATEALGAHRQEMRVGPVADAAGQRPRRGAAEPRAARVELERITGSPRTLAALAGPLAVRRVSDPPEVDARDVEDEVMALGILAHLLREVA